MRRGMLGMIRTKFFARFSLLGCGGLNSSLNNLAGEPTSTHSISLNYTTYFRTEYPLYFKFVDESQFE